MGLFDFIKGKAKEEVTIEQLMAANYAPKYAKECDHIWKNYVPKDGPASCLQGELLRAIESLRYEAQDNGNVNWDDDFVYFCDFIKKELCSRDIFSKQENFLKVQSNNPNL